MFSVSCCLQTMLCHRALEAVTPLVADCSVVTASDSAAIKEYCQLLLMRYWGVGVGRGGVGEG